ncbi:AsmA protein [Natronospira proteinivora]|uniref:AsmA protein n=1 Tax=Natronospira proteinivora TaxID=1807133 RepID=A0ABT1G9F2_9GAMM|nr:AsmA family protein [Natronospira proteinivora]MCP1727929.1 AsmA protein [Natronospira proteinivora]
MKRLLIALASILRALVLLLVLAVVIITMVIDPNDYREDVEAAVYDATGRNMQIQDELSLSFFPWLGVETGRVTLGNAEGFEDDFFSLDSADMRLRLIPLLRRQLEVAEIQVDGLRLNLAVNEDGVSNWDDLVAPEEAEDRPEEEVDAELDFSDLERIRIGGLSLSNATLSWRDDVSGLRARVDDWSLTLGEIRLGEPLSFQTALDFDLNEPELSGRLQANARLMADLAGDGRIRIDAMELELDSQGDILPVSPLAVQLSWRELLFDPEADRLTLEDFTGQLAEMPFGGDVIIDALSSDPRIAFELGSGDFPGAALMSLLGEDAPKGLDLEPVETVNWRLNGHLDTAEDRLTLDEGVLRLDELDAQLALVVEQLGAETPEVSGRLEIPGFSPRQLLTRIGLADMLPETSDPEVLERFALRSDLSYGQAGLALNELNLTLDDSRIQGAVTLPELEPLALRFDLHLDTIDLDRYMAPDEDGEPVDSDEPLDLDAIEIPAQAIRGHDLEGRLRIDSLMLAGMQLEEVETGVRIRDDVLRLAPIDARLYGGRQQGELEVDASGEVPQIRFTEELDGVRMQGLMNDLFQIEQFSGGLELFMELSGEGHTVGELRPTLDGRLRLRLDEGAIEGVDVAHALSEATARFRDDGSVAPDRGRTPFSTLALRGQIQEGRLTSEDFGLLVDKLAIRGDGWLSLVDFSMEYQMRAQVLDGARSELRADEFNVRGREFAFRITGTPLSPRLRFDVETMLRDATEDRVRDRADEVEDRLRDRFGR